MSGDKLTPVILSGGSGTRLWPLSTSERPKQFLPLVGEEPLIRQTAERCSNPELFEPPLIVSGATHEPLVEEALAWIDYRAILEPAPRNTAPAIALAALACAPDEILLVMPSDHYIGGPLGFVDAARRAARLAAEGRLVTFGLRPTAPETGYGYVKRGERIDECGFAVERFVEKPDLPTAERFLADGSYYWNGGLFAFRAIVYLEALAAFEPAMLEAAVAAMQGARSEGRIIRPDQVSFERSPSNSIDYAVMEKAANVAVVEADMLWSDVGNWNALHQVSTHHGDNSVGGDALLIECTGTMARSDGLRISALGVRDLVIVASGSDVIVLPRARAEEVKKLWEARERGRAG
ncbi:MAG TPA: sugar phosphate nucleotidyltransferase [Allosphingosinicella sp.]|uniref:mannose-1-phosphate guanylyltransferase n=1 Tax=Allosphingosinicella sp. TaxID=2823234 RepID=UPI002EDA0318